MENQSNSSNARERQKLSLYLDKKATDLVAFCDLSQFLLTPKKNKSHFSVLFSANKYQIINNMDGSSLGLATESEVVTHLSMLSDNRRTILSNNKLNDFSHYLKKMSKSVYNISSLIEFLGKLSQLKSYSSFQILLHEKGQTLCHNFLYDSVLNKNPNSISVSTFTSLLSKIKKSKNKQFNAKEIKYDDIGFIGSFLAKELEFTDITLIIMASRNDLFSASKEEKNYFSDFLTYSKYFIHKCGLYSIKKIRFDIIEQIVTNFPIGLSIIYDNEMISSKIDNTIDKENTYKHADLVHHSKLVLMGELLNTLGHELSNPLFGISISASILQEDFVNDEYINLTVKAIEESAKRCQDIIKNLSNLYNENSSNQTVNIKNLIDETITLTKSETRFIKKEVNFKNFNSDFDVVVNPTYISQILFNLILNSAQAMIEQEHTMNLIIIDVIKKTDFIDINVMDNGPGIESSLIEKIFTPFFTTKNSGTGLGLAICQKLAKNINGELYFNEKTELTCFTLRIKI